MKHRCRISIDLIGVHTLWMLKDLLRQPAYVVSTLAFPVLFYLIFAVPESTTMESSNYLMASFSAFAVFGVLFLQFGVSQAQERSHTWYRFIKSLPVSASDLLFARFMTAQVFAVLTVLLIVLAAHLWTKAQLNSREWIEFTLILFAPGLSFCAMGMALGLWTNERTSLPVGNLIYLPLSFLGGLWKPPEILPERLQKISEVLPTRLYGDMLWSIVKKEDFPWSSLWGLSLWTVLFGALILLGLRRDFERSKA